MRRIFFSLFLFLSYGLSAQPAFRFRAAAPSVTSTSNTASSAAPALNIKARIIDMPPAFSRDIRLITQDGEGYIWFATNQGIWRFDGTDAKLLDYRKLGLPQNLVPEALYCYGHFLVAYYLYTIYIYDQQEDRHFIYPLGLPIVSFDKDPAGALFFLTRDGQAWSFTRKSRLQKSFTLHDFGGWSDIKAIAKTLFDSSGQLYIFEKDRVGRPEKNKTITWSEVTDPKSPPRKEASLEYINNALSTARYLLAGYSGGFIIYDKQSLAKVYEFRGFDFACALKRDDQLVLLARKPGVRPLIRPSGAFIVQEALFRDTIGFDAQVSALDPEKIWISTTIGLAEVLLHGGTVFSGSRQIQLQDFFHSKSVRSIFRCGDTLYVGTYSGYYSCDRSGIHLLFPEIVFTTRQVDDHTLLLGLEGGTGFVLLDTRSQRYHFITHKNGTIETRTIFKDGDYYLAAGFSEIYKVEPRASPMKWSVDSFLRDSCLGMIRAISRIRGQVWIACQNGVYRMDNSRRLTKIYPRSTSLMIYSMQETPEGIWLATHGQGLVRIDAEGNTLQVVGFNEGLAGDFVYSMQHLNGLLVTGTNNGLSIFDIASGMQALPLKEDEKQNGSSRQELNHSAIYYDSVGQQLIMGGLEGLLFVDLAYYSSRIGNKRDRLTLSYTKEATKGMERPEANLFAALSKNVLFLPEDVFIGLKFGCPQSPGEKQALFRIRGLDDKWQKINIGQEVALYALPPGDYTLDARWPADQDKSLWFSKSLQVEPHFYQTFLFRGGLTVLLLFIIYLIWRARLKKLKDNQLLRTSIASDLHDEIGGTLARISFSCELLLMDRQHEPVKLQNISEESKKAIASISDIIWSIDARNDTRDDLILRMQEHAILVLEDKAPDVQIKTTGLNPIKTIPQAVRQNIYLIFKEAISNIVRHNERPEVWITFDNSGPGFSMEIKNTVDRPRPANSYSGQGLRNMKMRADRIRAVIDIDRDGKFFTIRVKVKKTRRTFKR
ncbi:MAG TPA: hypothetical protein VNS58_24785 [Puia sp.]|nr:hypothetical protein [Puia sp.]